MPKEKTKKECERGSFVEEIPKGESLHCFPRFRAGPLQTATGTVTSFPFPQGQMRSNEVVCARVEPSAVVEASAAASTA